MGFLDIVRNTIQSNGLLSGDDRILVGISGGGDSVGLCSILRLFGSEYSYRVAWAHYNYRLRGSESEAEEVYVRELADRWGIELHISSPDSDEYAHLSTRRSEAFARHLRYGFFRELMEKEGFNKLAIGHTLDDQAETILMRIIRGTSHTGFGGMRAWNSDGIIRPLLEVSRDQVRQFLEENSIRYCQDSSNESLYYMRNRIRKIILPMLKGENPMIVHALAQLSKSVNRIEALVSGIVLEKEADILLDRSKNCVVIDYTGFMELDIEIRNRIIKSNWQILCVDGSDKHLQFRHLESIGKLLNQTEHRYWEVHLPSDVVLKRQAGELIIERRRDDDTCS